MMPSRHSKRRLRSNTIGIFRSRRTILCITMNTSGPKNWALTFRRQSRPIRLAWSGMNMTRRSNFLSRRTLSLWMDIYAWKKTLRMKPLRRMCTCWRLWANSTADRLCRWRSNPVILATAGQSCPRWRLWRCQREPSESVAAWSVMSWCAPNRFRSKWRHQIQRHFLRPCRWRLWLNRLLTNTGGTMKRSMWLRPRALNWRMTTSGIT